MQLKLNVVIEWEAPNDSVLDATEHQQIMLNALQETIPSNSLKLAIRRQDAEPQTLRCWLGDDSVVAIAAASRDDLLQKMAAYEQHRQRQPAERRSPALTEADVSAIFDEEHGCFRLPIRFTWA